mmetsp:Transcript_36196/g.58490  ORF Transcript_36196/g.58490 Transcript_36196/m.58490 type:complete len:166 (-) Transcript_36196:237-734(-)|eukprot:CAMPEP_0184655868 /NCGR_PEP_ID=MMETSP0308-20130426/14726_1 /TAXON_ID=38269 /ORGANISM="Gloeochaete witrockiana, Strain SAG 46.84" /LENGTH=165 /DNA_ID=CAMNT_0027092665 /DNA_START=55 /DNA_END=552 /DNA_ORIENTATION=+
MAHKGVSFPTLSGSGLRIGIVRTRWNETIIANLVAGSRRALEECGVKPSNIHEIEVPGSFELPFGAQQLIEHGKSKRAPYDAVICVGCLIKGETMHFEYIADAASHGLMRVGLESKIPVIFGMLTCLTEEQAVKRSTGDSNHGYDWGKGAVQMAQIVPKRQRAKL